MAVGVGDALLADGVAVGVAEVGAAEVVGVSVAVGVGAAVGVGEVAVGVGAAVDRLEVGVGLGLWVGGALDRVAVGAGATVWVGEVVGRALVVGVGVVDLVAFGRGAQVGGRQVGFGPRYQVGGDEVVYGAGVEDGRQFGLPVGSGRGQGRRFACPAGSLAWVTGASSSYASLSGTVVSVSAELPEATLGLAGTAETALPIPSGSVPNRIRPATASPTTPAAVPEANRARLGIIVVISPISSAPA